MMRRAIFDKGQAAPCPNPFNLTDYVLKEGADSNVALEVFADGVDRWRYADLRDAVWRTAGGLLDLELKAGDRLLLRIGNDPAFPILFLAAIAVGIVPVPTSAQLTDDEVRSIVNELKPSMVAFAGGLKPIQALGTAILDEQGIKHLRSAAPAQPILSDPDRLAYMIYTSGTSGKPRAVMHAHRAIWARRMMWEGWYGLGPADRMLHAGAFNWTYTLGTGLLDPWAVGATAMVYAGPPDRKVWGMLANKHDATIFAAAPGVYRQLTEVGAVGFDKLRHGLSAGEKMPQSVMNAWEDQTGKCVYEALGMSEVSTFISSSPTVPNKPKTAGRVQEGRRVCVLDEGKIVGLEEPGELAVSADDPGLMLGYYNQPVETAEKYHEDWFLTGDMVSMDQDGYVTYLGRNDDMLNAGGFRVSPIEIEAVMMRCDGIHEAAAVEVEVRENVRVIAGFYVADQDLNEPLTVLCMKALAKYKRPRMFIKIDALPKGANNKIARKALRNWSLSKLG